MELFRNISETVSDALDYVVEKNKKFNKSNKIKKYIKKETDNIIKAYILLGKHYFQELRDVPNYDMQELCDEIDNSKKEIKKLKNKLANLKNEDKLSNFDHFLEDDFEDFDFYDNENSCSCGSDCSCSDNCEYETDFCECETCGASQDSCESDKKNSTPKKSECSKDSQETQENKNKKKN